MAKNEPYLICFLSECNTGVAPANVSTNARC